MNNRIFKALLLTCFYTMTSYSQTIEEIVTAFKSKDFKKTINISKQYIESYPDDFNALLALGKSYNSLSKHKEAISYLEKAKKNSVKDWQFSWVYIELIKANFAIGNLKESRENYEIALQYKGTKNSKKELKSIAFIFGYDNFYNDWETLETDNIIFHFQKGTDIESKKIFMERRENAFVKINSFFNSNLPKKIDFFVWNSNNDAIKLLKKPLGFTKPQFCISHNRTNQTLGHELTHNISFWLKDKKKITRFINEGISVYFDLSNRNKIEKAKNVLKKHKTNFTIKNFWVKDKEFPEEILYPVAGAFVEHLISFDKEKFLHLCKNQTFQNAQIIYGTEFENLIKTFNEKTHK